MPSPQTANMDEQIRKINANIHRLSEIKKKMSKAILFKSSLDTKIEGGREDSDSTFVANLLKKDSSTKEKKPLSDDIQKIERALALQYQEINVISRMDALKEDWEFLQSRLPKSSAVSELHFTDTSDEEGNILELNTKAIENYFKILEDPNASVPQKVEISKQIEDAFVKLKSSMVATEKGIQESLASSIKKNDEVVIPEKMDIFGKLANLFRSFLRQIDIYEMITGGTRWGNDKKDLADEELILSSNFSEKSKIPASPKDKPITNRYIEELESHTQALKEIEEQQHDKIGEIEERIESLQKKEMEVRPKYAEVSSGNSALIKQLSENYPKAQQDFEKQGEKLRLHLGEGPKFRFLGLFNNLSKQYDKLDELIKESRKNGNDDLGELIKFQTTIDQLMQESPNDFFKRLSPQEYKEFLKDPNGYECIRHDSDGEEIRVKPEVAILDDIEDQATKNMGSEATTTVSDTIRVMQEGSAEFSRLLKKDTESIVEVKNAAEAEVKRYEESQEEYNVAESHHSHYSPKFFPPGMKKAATPAPAPEANPAKKSEETKEEEPTPNDDVRP